MMDQNRRNYLENKIHINELKRSMRWQKQDVLNHADKIHVELLERIEETLEKRIETLEKRSGKSRKGIRERY